MLETLETKRLILRKFLISDLNDFFAYAKNPNVGPAAGWKPHTTEDETLHVLTDFIRGNEVWALEFKENKKVIGSIGLHLDELRNGTGAKNMGFVLAEDYWGIGLMTEAVEAVIEYAFKVLEIPLLSVAHYPFNNRSKRVIEKNGFQYEGTLRQARRIYNGNVYDLVCYSITKDEWAKLRLGKGN